MYDDRIFKTLLTTLLRMGDVVVDGDQNIARDRKRTIDIAKNSGADVYCYTVKRPPEDCIDEFHGLNEVKASFNIHHPVLSEGFTKIFTVKWAESEVAMIYGDESLMIKPKIALIDEIKDARPIVIKPKKKAIKRKLERGRQNLFRPKKNQ